jgi:hypothetical protein
LHHRVVPVVLNSAESTVACDHVSGARQCATDRRAGREQDTAVHQNRRPVTNHGCAIGIHTKKVSGHKIIVAGYGDQCLVCIGDARKAESLDRGAIARMTGSTPIYIAEVDHRVAAGVADDFDTDVCVISDRERVWACARLRIAVDDHRLIESITEITRSAKAISERDRANVRRWVAAGIAGRNVKRNEVCRSGGRRMRVRRVNRLPQRAS